VNRENRENAVRLLHAAIAIAVLAAVIASGIATVFLLLTWGL
jgi:hypothetical protein